MFDDMLVDEALSLEKGIFLNRTSLFGMSWLACCALSWQVVFPEAAL